MPLCEIKRVVDDDAVGARSVVAADFDGDGLNDLASASKDDNTVAVYLNREGFAKRVVSSERKGSYGLAAADVDQREAARRGLEESTTGATKRSWGSSSSRSGSMDSTGVTSLTTGSKAARFSFLRSFSTKGSQAQLGQQNSLVSLDSYAFPTHEKSVTLSAATTRSKVAAMRLEASAGDGDEDALSPV